MASSNGFTGRPRRLATTLATLALLAAPAVLVAQVGQYVASPLAAGQRVVLVANRFSDFVAEGPSGRLAALAREAELHGQAVAAVQAEDAARTALSAGGIDVLMLSPGPNSPDENVDRFADVMIATHMQGRILVQDTWSADAAGGVDAGRLERLRARLAAINERAGHEMAYLVPAADAVDRLRWEVALGHVPGVPRQADLFVGDEASASVANLVTYLSFTVMYRQPATGLTALVDPTDATSWPREQILQRIAWDAAAAEPMSGIMLDHIWLGRTRGVHPHAAGTGEGNEGHGATAPHPPQMPPGGRE